MRRRMTSRSRLTFSDRSLIALIQSARGAGALDSPALSFPPSLPGTNIITSCACLWRASGTPQVSHRPGGRR